VDTLLRTVPHQQSAATEKDRSMTKTIVVALVTVAALTSPVFAQGIEPRTPETLVIAGQHTTIPLLTLTQAMDLTNFRTPTGS
jgi:hypothetical protein